jgi:hypothetical protein
MRCAAAVFKPSGKNEAGSSLSESSNVPPKTTLPFAILSFSLIAEFSHETTVTAMLKMSRRRFMKYAFKGEDRFTIVNWTYNGKKNTATICY